jgi:hypothetical protein
MLFNKITAVYFENRKTFIRTVCEQNAKLLIVKQVVHIVTTGWLLSQEVFLLLEAWKM